MMTGTRGHLRRRRHGALGTHGDGRRSGTARRRRATSTRGSAASTYAPPEKHEVADFAKLNPWYYSDAPKTVRPVLDIARRTSTFDEVVRGLDETQRAVRGAPLPVLRQLLRMRQLLRRVPGQRRDQARPGQALRIQLRLLQGLRHLRLGMPLRGDQDGAGVRPDIANTRPPADARRRRKGTYDDRRKTRSRHRRSSRMVSARLGAPARADAQQGHRLHRGRARRARHPRTAAAARDERRTCRSRACSRTSARRPRTSRSTSTSTRCTTATRRCSSASSATIPTR